MAFENELRTALKAAKIAGKYLVKNQGKAIVAKEKGSNKNFATLQDIKSDKKIIDAIRSDFPDDFILSEESISELGEATRFWIIDPIDGTRSYASGLAYYAVSIALYQDGKIQVGVVYAPSCNNELFHAIRGQGAFLNNEPLNIHNPNHTLNSSIVATGFAYFKGENLKKALVLYEKVLNKSADVVRFGSAALDLCHVAAGRIGAYYESGLKPWDLAGGLLILQEQQGVITDYKGENLNIFRTENDKFSVKILSSKNSTIHSELVGILSS